MATPLDGVYHIRPVGAIYGDATNIPLIKEIKEKLKEEKTENNNGTKLSEAKLSGSWKFARHEVPVIPLGNKWK